LLCLERKEWLAEASRKRSRTASSRSQRQAVTLEIPMDLAALSRVECESMAATNRSFLPLKPFKTFQIFSAGLCVSALRWASSYTEIYIARRLRAQAPCHRSSCSVAESLIAAGVRASWTSREPWWLSANDTANTFQSLEQAWT
jgi:hypothetical protein